MSESFSEKISAVCKMLEQSVKDYEWSLSEVSRLEALQQDYLHMLELGGLKYAERAKVATKLSKCRIERRVNKDTAQTLEPLVQYMKSERGRQLLNLLREVLGKTRRIENRMQTRVYHPRVLSDDEYGCEKPENTDFDSEASS